MNDTPSASEPVSRATPINQTKNQTGTTKTTTHIANNRPGRIATRKSTDKHPAQHYGDTIQTKHEDHVRIFLQNSKGLTYSKPPTDFEYYFSSLHDIKVDIAGMVETNIAWQNPFIRSELSSCTRKIHGSTRLSYGYPTSEVDPIEGKDTFHAGGSLTAALGYCSSMTFGPDIIDPTGLGRWSGCTLRGKNNKMISIITAYRVCATTVNAAPRGSTFTREYDHLRSIGLINPNPRRHILESLRGQLHALRIKGHSILLMMDANTVLSQDRALLELIHDTGLRDLHSSQPAPATYIGSDSRRIDYMFGCDSIYRSMTRSGTLSYLEGPQSDHRGLFVDLDPKELFGIPKMLPPNITPHFTRFLKSANPEHVTTYNKAVLEYYHQHNMVKRLATLHTQSSHLPITVIRHQRLEKWDRDQGRAMKHAELQLQKPPAKYPWSPKLRNAGLTCRYWRLRFREAKYNEDHTMSIRSLQYHVQHYDPTFSFPHMDQHLEIIEIHQHMRAAKKSLRTIQRTALETRYQSYQALLNQYEMDANPDTRKESNRRAKVIRNTISAEKCRAMFNHIRKYSKPTEPHTGLAQLLVPSRLGEHPKPQLNIQNILETTPPTDIFWETVIDRAEIEEYLLRYNQRSFRAASASPCGHGPIYEAITFKGISLSADQLLSGTIPPDWDTDHTPLLNDFLLSFSGPVVSEPTSNSQAQTEQPIEQEVTEEDILYGFKSWKEKTSTSPSGRHLGHYRSLIQDETLLTCLTQFMNIAIRSGISISRWSEAINVLIEKDPGTPKLTRLRIIHLFEADLNLYLKLQWGHRLVRHALKKRLIHPGQHGSVPGRTTMDPIMLNQLTTDLCRISKHNYAHFDNDASACYDRIIVPLAMLAARRCGMQKEAITLHATTLQNMRYKVKTAYGISEKAYTGSCDHPLFGTGQGSGASPAAWLTLVVVLMYALERVTMERVRFHSPNTDKVHERILDAYVDDTAISFTSSSDSSFDDILLRLEVAAQKWERLLFYSGGALNLSKCSWLILHWTWHQGHPIMNTSSPTQKEVKLVTQADLTTTTTINRAPLDQPARILGVYLTPTGNFDHQLRILKNKADQMALNILSPHLTASDIRIFHRTMYTPAITYPLPAIAANEEKFESVQSKILASVLRKMGAARHTPVPIRHGPVELGGLNLLDLRTESGISRIRYMFDAIYRKSEAGELLILNVKLSQIETGLQYPLLEHPSQSAPYATQNTWVMSLRRFLAQHNLTITLTDQYRCPLHGKYDTTIMQPAILNRYTRLEQSDINLTRLHLQAYTLSDITDPQDDTCVCESAFAGRRRLGQIPNKAWPNQPIPTKAQVNIWQKYLSSTHLRYGRKWQANPIKPLPSLATSITDQKETLPTQYDTLSEYLATLPTWHQRLLLDYTQIATDLHVWKAFHSKRRVEIASDGGLSDKKGSFGWKIVDNHLKPLFQGSGPVDGPMEVGSSTRSELGGLTAPLLLITTLA